jgi:hypothetical protein
MNEDQWFWTLSEFLDGRGTLENRRLVDEALACDPRVQKMYVDLINLEEGLSRSSEERWMEAQAELEEVGASVWGRRSAWNLWAGLVAGGVLGALLSASVVWAFNGGRWEAKTQPVAIANADFESGNALQASGVPGQVGLWGGDYAEITGEQRGVMPASGMRMLKFLRADNRLTPLDSLTAAGEVWQWVKVDQFPAHAGRRVAAVELSARFNAVEDAAEEMVAFGVSLWAFDADVAAGPALWREHRMLALASGSREELADRDSGTWQTVTARMSVPAEANLVLLGVRVGRKGTGKKSPVFGAHFVDDVRLRVVETVSREGTDATQELK